MSDSASAIQAANLFASALLRILIKSAITTREDFNEIFERLNYLLEIDAPEDVIEDFITAKIE